MLVPLPLSNGPEQMPSSSKPKIGLLVELSGRLPTALVELLRIPTVVSSDPS